MQWILSTSYTKILDTTAMEPNAGYDEDKVTTGSRQEAVRARERERERERLGVGGAGSGRGCAMYPPGYWPMALHRVLLLTTKN